MFVIFRLFDIFHRGCLTKTIDHLFKKRSFFICSDFSLILNYHIFGFLLLIYVMVKDIGRLHKYNQPKQSTPPFKKPVLSSSAAHTSSTSNSTRTSILSQLDNKDIIKNQNRNNISNTDDMNSCVTPRKKKLQCSGHI